MQAFLYNILRKKNEVHCDPGYKRVLGAFDLTLLGIGAIIGTGIFVLTGVAAATASGPAVVLSFMVAGLACAFAALCYSELAASVGGSGSAYGYSYAAFGELIAWIIGWDLILEYGVAVAAVANGWSGYFNNALQAIGLGLPHSLTHGPFAVDAATGLANPGIVNLPAMLIIFMLMFLLIQGARESARLNAAMVFIKLLTIFVFVAVGIFHVQPDNWSPFMPFGWFSHNELGAPIGILAGASIVFFAYVGFDAVSTAVEESKNPQRDVPIGILCSLAFCTLIYVIVSALLTGMVHYTELNVSFPVSFALERVGVTWASALVATGVITGLTTVMLVLYYALTRVISAMSRDGLIAPFFGKVSEKTQTPVRATIMCGVIMAIMAGFMPLGALAELVNIGTLSAFILVCFGVMVLRKTRPDMPRPFRIPFGNLIPVLGVLSCGALIAFLPTETHLRFIIWLLLGFVIYFSYGYRKSSLRLAS
jgi:APA family basic amino acid/polyamine antiporter